MSTVKKLSVPGANFWVSRVVVDGDTLMIITTPHPSLSGRELRANIFKLAAELELRIPSLKQWLVVPGHVSHYGRGQYSLTVRIESDGDENNVSDLLKQLKEEILTHVYIF